MLKDIFHNKNYLEAVRFAFVGGIATLLQIVIYYLLASIISHNWALLISYAISLVINFLLTIYFTFQVRPTTQKGVGFLSSHAINIILQVLFLNLFIWGGIDKQIAIIPVLAVCVPINFMMVRHAIKKL